MLYNCKCENSFLNHSSRVIKILLHDLANTEIYYFMALNKIRRNFKVNSIFLILHEKSSSVISKVLMAPF